jgi:ferredoxin-NADP reductase
MKLKLVKKNEEAKGTMSFVFEPEKEVNWLPGQYFYWSLPELKDDPKGNTRHFTIHLSPSEGKNIGLTTRIRDVSPFKQAFSKLNIGDIVQGEGPEGTFVLDEHEKGEHVLMAGGIGITPFRSFIKYNIDKGLKDTKLHLIYANSNPLEIAFKSELESWAKAADNITVDMTVSEPDSSWNGLTGRIDAAMIQKLIGNWQAEIGKLTFWLCGPPPMAEAMEKILGSMNISSGKVRSEKFTGY